MNFIDQLLLDRYDELMLSRHGLGSRWDTVMLTPRYVTSRHIVALVYSPGDREPTLVLKVPRQPGDNDGVRREATLLSELTTLGGGRVRGAPQLVGLVDIGAHSVLIETAVRGSALDPQRVAADLPGAVRAGTSFVETLPVTRTAAENGGWYRTWIEEPLEALAVLAPLGGEVARLTERTHDLLGPLRSVPMPAVFEHADLSHPNLLLGAGGALQVVDWERGSVRGMPGHDLIFFLQYLSESAAGVYARQEQLRAFDHAFGPGGWARNVVMRHLTLRFGDAGPDLLAQLVLATWARSTATLVDRLAPNDPVSHALHEDQRSAAVANDRDFWLWRHAISVAESGSAARGGPPSGVPGA